MGLQKYVEVVRYEDTLKDPTARFIRAVQQIVRDNLDQPETIVDKLSSDAGLRNYRILHKAQDPGIVYYSGIVALYNRINDDNMRHIKNVFLPSGT